MVGMVVLLPVVQDSVYRRRDGHNRDRYPKLASLLLLMVSKVAQTTDTYAQFQLASGQHLERFSRYGQFKEQVTATPIDLVASVSLPGSITGLSVFRSSHWPCRPGRWIAQASNVEVVLKMFTVHATLSTEGKGRRSENGQDERSVSLSLSLLLLQLEWIVGSILSPLDA